MGANRPCLIMKSSRASVPLMLLFLPGDAPMSDGCTPIPYARMFDTSSRSASISPPVPVSFLMGSMLMLGCCELPSRSCSETKESPEFLLLERNLSRLAKKASCASCFCLSVVAAVFA